MTIERRFEIVKKLKREYFAERVIFLITNVISFMCLMACLIWIFCHGEINGQILGTIFGSSGVVGVSCYRILKMWDDSLRVVFGEKK
jgi:hypothetical protein